MASRQAGMPRVLVIEPSPRVREAVKNLLEAAGRCQVVGEAAGTDEASELARRLAPEVIVMRRPTGGPPDPPAALASTSVIYYSCDPWSDCLFDPDPGAQSAEPVSAGGLCDLVWKVTRMPGYEPARRRPRPESEPPGVLQR